MARNEEKAHSMLNRWLELQKIEAGIRRPKETRPYLAELCTNVVDAERWRMEVIQEIGKHVLHIQNASLEEHKVRDLNDKINKLIREKGHWEARIKELGGTTFAPAPVLEEGEGVIRAPGGYYYFGAAKNLPGVKELLAPKKKPEIKRTRFDMYKGVDVDYYGFRDDEDGILQDAEAKAEKKAREAAIVDWELTQIQKGKSGVDQEEVEEEEEEADNLKRHVVEILDEDDENPRKRMKVHKSHVPLPSDQDIEKLLLEKRKQDLINKYIND